MFPHGETVTRLRANAVADPYSGESTATDWSSPDELALTAGVADGGSIEPSEDARNAVHSDFDVILPAGSDVRATDRMVVRALTCEVVGRPFDWVNPFSGWAPGMVIRCKVVEG